MEYSIDSCFVLFSVLPWPDCSCWNKKSEAKESKRLEEVAAGIGRIGKETRELRKKKRKKGTTKRRTPKRQKKRRKNRRYCMLGR